MTPPPTPELDKLELVWPKAIVIMEFLNWLQKEYTVCDGHCYRTGSWPSISSSTCSNSKRFRNNPRLADLKVLVDAAKEIERLRKENEVLLGDLQSCQAGHEALVKERDQLKLHVQVLLEALELGLENLRNVVVTLHHKSVISPDARDAINKIKDTLSTTPSLNDYVPRSVADELCQSTQWGYDRLSHLLFINDNPKSIEASFGTNETMQTLRIQLKHIKDALTAYQSTKKEHNV